MSTATKTEQILVTCTRVASNLWGRHEGITHIGGSGWIWTKEQVVAELESPSCRYTFFTSVDGNTAIVGVWTGTNGQKYLSTYADGDWNNNLLALPSCQ